MILSLVLEIKKIIKRMQWLSLKINLPKQNWKAGVFKTYGRLVCESLRALSASTNEEFI